MKRSLRKLIGLMIMVGLIFTCGHIEVQTETIPHVLDDSSANVSKGVITGFSSSALGMDIGRYLDITIPDTLEGQEVTGIGANVFSIQYLEAVTMPNTIITIGNNAFLQNSLTSVTIPNSVDTVGENAFSDNMITSVTIKSGNTTIVIQRLTIRAWKALLGNGILRMEMNFLFLQKEVTIRQFMCIRSSIRLFWRNREEKNSLTL